MSLKNDNKVKQLERFNKFYVSKMNGIYKGILKNYSIQLADKMSSSLVDRNDVYNNIFDTLEDYISNILPIKVQIEGKENYKEISEDYEKLENFLTGKLDDRDKLEKKMYLFAISRKLFTHSLPLVVAEQCYEKLLEDARELVVNTKKEPKKSKAYELLMTLIEEYNVKLLSTKIYWENPKEREEFKKFWDEYQEINKKKEKGQAQKEILFIKRELKYLENNNQNKKIIRIYKDKLVKLGVLKPIKNAYKSEGKYIKKVVRV